MRPTRCPLCSAHVDDDDDLRRHLAQVHDLEDDPGTASRLSDLDPCGAERPPAPEPVPDAASTAAGAGGAADAPAPEPERSPVLTASGLPAASLRVHDPGGDDARWRALVLGVGGLLLLLFAAYALALGSG